jgi:hypothetical protein
MNDSTLIFNIKFNCIKQIFHGKVAKRILQPSQF